MAPLTRKFLTSLLMGALLIAMVANGALAAGRAASHAGHAAATINAVPPCHHVVDTDALAPLAATACDTLCAGSAPEVTLDHPPSPDPFIASVVVAALEVEPCYRNAVVPQPAQHHPPPISPYQRDRRLLI